MPGQSRHPRPEPAWFTTGDLLALAIGGALASATLWFFFADVGPVVGWVTAPEFTRAACYRVALALVPVVLARRAAYGGVVRPAEFPIGHVGLSFLFVALTHWPALGVLVADHQSGSFIFTSEMTYWLNLGGQFTIAAVAALAVLFLRSRLPGWALTLCLWLAWMGLRDIEGLWREGVNPFLIEVESVRCRRWLGMLLIELPWSFAFAIPLVAAVLGMIGGRSGPRTWVEWSGVALIPVLYLSAETIFFAGRHASLPPAEFAAELGETALIWALALALSVAIVRRYGPAFGRWLGPGYDGERPRIFPGARED